VLEIFINVEYGYKISEVAREVQSAVKKEVETMTDMQVAAVNVHVLNIIQEKEKDKDKDKEVIETEIIE
ncbi:MAG TPA: Asp23/Gls24 family envelope stress response protein, partial [Clostridiales bacterium]|nr:Asp23/Gls24 family envelope stress response protein [Clostridiales bacterium]